MKKPVPHVAALLGALLGLATLAHAEVTIAGPRSLELEPGESRVVEYTITNAGAEPVQATVFFNDYAQLPDGSLVHVPANSLPQSLFNIATFDRLTYALDPQESASVPLRIQVPEAALGGYWGVVGVEIPPPPVPEGQNTVGFHTRYAMVTALDVTGAERHEVALANLAPSPAGESLTATVHNTGTSYERFDLELVFQGADGQSFTSTVPSVILPGLTVDLAVPVPAELPAGTYGIFAALVYGEGSRSEAVGTIEVRE